MKRRYDYFQLKCLAAVLLLAGVTYGQTGQQRTLTGHVPAAVRHLTPLGRIDPATNLTLTIGLPLHHTDALTNLLERLYDPSCPEYHQYLTPDQFNERFGPTEADYQALQKFVQAHGLAVTTAYADRHLLEVRGLATNVEQAFHVTLREYRHPTENRTFYAPDTEPVVDATTPVADIWGLSNYPRPHANTKKIKPLDAQTAKPNYTGSCPYAGQGYFWGKDFRNAYVPGLTNLTGSGQTIGLFELDGFYTNDIASYVSQAGFTTNTVLQTVPFNFSFPADTQGADDEVALDIEMALSMAPNASRIIVYEGNPSGFSPSTMINRMVSDNLAKQISSSWSWSGGPSTTIDSYLQQLAAAGTSYFQSSGDDEAYTNGEMDISTNAYTPVDSPYLTSVGATTLSMSGSGGAWNSEVVWNWGFATWIGAYTGTGGGISSYYSIPTWQKGVSMANNKGSTAMRNIPDVAMVGDGIYVVSGNGQSGGMGGTSCAAPLWAGMCALINQYATNHGYSTVGFLNPALYGTGRGPLYATAFHDITTGDNTSPTSPTNFYAVSGYDLCTGWGTPKGSGLISALFSPEPVLLQATFSDVAGGNSNGSIDPGEMIQESVVWTNMGYAAATNVTATLVAASPYVTMIQAGSSYPNIPAGGLATNTTPFSYRVLHAAPAGATLVFTNVLNVSGLMFTGVFSHVVGFYANTNYVFAGTNASGAAIAANTVVTTNIPIFFSTPGTITNVTASVRLNFGRDSRLAMSLSHPDGTSITLCNGAGGTGANFGTNTPPAALIYTTFSDQATTNISSGIAPFLGAYKPSTALGTFIGKQPTGTWQLAMTSGNTYTGIFYACQLAITVQTYSYTDTVYGTAPVANSQSKQVFSGVKTWLTLSGSNADGSALTFLTNSLPAHGTLSGFNTNTGVIAYTSIPGFKGTDSFTFAVQNWYTNSASATVSLQVTPSSTLLFLQ